MNSWIGEQHLKKKFVIVNFSHQKTANVKHAAKTWPTTIADAPPKIKNMFSKAATDKFWHTIISSSLHFRCLRKLDFQRALR